MDNPRIVAVFAGHLHEIFGHEYCDSYGETADRGARSGPTGIRLVCRLLWSVQLLTGALLTTFHSSHLTYRVMDNDVPKLHRAL